MRVATTGDAVAISEILASGFETLFRAEYGLRQVEVAGLLANLYREGVLPIARVQVATVEGAVCGVAILSTPGVAWRGPGQLHNWRTLRFSVGIRRALRAGIGSALMRYYFRGRTPHDGEAYLDALAVREEFRRRGVGTTLVLNCIETARLAGCGEIALHVSEAKPDVRRLYESLGFAARPESRWLPRLFDSITSAVDRITKSSYPGKRSVLMARKV